MSLVILSLKYSSSIKFFICKIWTPFHRWYGESAGVAEYSVFGIDLCLEMTSLQDSNITLFFQNIKLYQTGWNIFQGVMSLITDYSAGVSETCCLSHSSAMKLWHQANQRLLLRGLDIVHSSAGLINFLSLDEWRLDQGLNCLHDFINRDLMTIAILQ